MHVAKTQFEESLLALLFECEHQPILKQETNYQTMIKINFFLLLRIIKAPSNQFRLISPYRLSKVQTSVFKIYIKKTSLIEHLYLNPTSKLSLVSPAFSIVPTTFFIRKI